MTSTLRAPRRRRIVLLLIAACAVGAVLIAGAAFLTTSRPPVAPAAVDASPAATASSAAEAAPEESEPTTTAAIELFLTASMEDTAPDPSTIARDSALSELEAQRTEFEVNGWAVSGRPSLDELRVLASDPVDGTATVEACVDSSDVQVLRQDGSPALGDPIGTQRSIQIFTLAEIDRQWYVTATSFPDDAAC